MSSLTPGSDRHSDAAARVLPHEVAGRVSDVIVGLGDVYLREGVHIWLTGRHKLLDDRAPVDVIREPGGLERVEALVDQLRSGASA